MKTYVDVIAEFTSEGQVLPREIIWEDGRRFSIDRIISVRNAASLKAGGAGIRYICRIMGKERALFLENGTRWFVE